MLVIRRKPGESILIGGEIEIEVIELSPTRVKIGISAPPDVLILRKEIRLAAQENLAAARGVSHQSAAAFVARFSRRHSPESPLIQKAAQLTDKQIESN